MPESKAPSTMRSLERAIDVLEVLEATKVPLRLSEVARRAGLHVATTQRILGVLVERGRAAQDESGYRMGVAMLFGAHAYLTSDRVALAAPLVLQQLADSTGLTASVFVRVGHSRAVIGRIEGADPLRYVLPIGERLPIHLGAGKVLCAYLPWAEVVEMIGAESFARADGSTVTLSDFREQLELVRTRGWVVSQDERVVGASSVAAPVLSAPGECRVCVQVAGPSRNPAFEDSAALGLEVRLAAGGLAARLGWPA